jgi:hypothetical protein
MSLIPALAKQLPQNFQVVPMRCPMQGCPALGGNESAIEKLIVQKAIANEPI